MTDLILTGPIKSALDSATNNKPNIAYWKDEDVFITNRKHLEYINSLGVYVIDVDNIINALEALSINQVDTSIPVVEQIIGQPIKLEDLSGINISNPDVNHFITWDLKGNLINSPPPDVQYKHSNLLWATTGEGEDTNFWDTLSFIEDTQVDRDNAAKWNIVSNCYLTANCVDISDYKVTLNFVCSVSSNNRAMKFGIFKNSKELETFTQEFNFSEKDEQKSISIVEFIGDVKKGDVISLRAQQAGNKRTTLSVGRRSMFIEELR